MSPVRILESWWQEHGSVGRRCTRPGCERPADPWFGDVCAACGLDEMLREPDRFEEDEASRHAPHVH